ncbi:MAG: glycine cleavage system protein GcvH [Acidimicrobiia bacterium]
MNVPDQLLYTEEHEWIDVQDDGTIKVGITDYAQEELGDVVFVELPSQGEEMEASAVMAEVESTKSVAEVYAPATGTVVAVNEELADKPELVNQDPYGAAWFVILRPDQPLDESDFLGAEAYRALIG